MDIRIGIVTGSKVAPNADGAEPGRVLQAVITDVQDTQNVQTCQAGDEYHPPNGATVVLSAGGSAYKIALTFDDGIAPIMEKGGRRIYATDADGAAEVAEARLHPDGKIELLNDQADLTMLPDGTVTIANGAGGATLSPAGVWTFHGTASHFDHPVTMAETLEVTGALSSLASVTAPQVTGSTDVTAGSKALAAHKHTTTTTGAPTSAPL